MIVKIIVFSLIIKYCLWIKVGNDIHVLENNNPKKSVLIIKYQELLQKLKFEVDDIINQSVQEFMNEKGIDIIVEPIFYNSDQMIYNSKLAEELFNILNEKLNLNNVIFER